MYALKGYAGANFFRLEVKNLSKVSIKDAIVSASEILDLKEEVQAYFDGSDTSAKADVENLLRCFNLVESELALEYLPLYAEETLESATGAVYFDELACAPVRIVRVQDEWGNSCPFKLYPNYLKTQAGKVTIRYTYLPQEKGLDGVSDFTLRVSKRLFAYGMATEYALSCGRFDEASVWEKKYKDAITSAYRAKPSTKISARRWV